MLEELRALKKELKRETIGQNLVPRLLAMGQEEGMQAATELDKLQEELMDDFSDFGFGDEEDDDDFYDREQ